MWWLPTNYSYDCNVHPWWPHFSRVWFWKTNQKNCKITCARYLAICLLFFKSIRGQQCSSLMRLYWWYWRHRRIFSLDDDCRRLDKLPGWKTEEQIRLKWIYVDSNISLSFYLILAIFLRLLFAEMQVLVWDVHKVFLQPISVSRCEIVVVSLDILVQIALTKKCNLFFNFGILTNWKPNYSSRLWLLLK